MDERVWIVAGPEFRAVGDALRQIDARLPNDFRKTIVRKARPYVAEVKALARALPTPMQAGHTGLRRRVAAGVHTRAKLGANAGVRISTRMADPSQAIIPRGLDSRTGSGGWVHPVFGHGHSFQHGFSWFTEPLGRKGPDMRDALKEELQRAAEYVAARGGSI